MRPISGLDLLLVAIASIGFVGFVGTVSTDSIFGMDATLLGRLALGLFVLSAATFVVVRVRRAYA